ncbi:Calcineurin-like phosphoesterase [Aspergillus sclerotialis]|uniref:Calcineurin-like phosphoesterase n=1 Tax=Aspergillus sclerotialis TaxID=2070753 RepID=A0A3A3A9I3_9EURO|nr:Calcineurin-like phosphoesterase [Aspergillus sclerotialis]
MAHPIYISIFLASDTGCPYLAREIFNVRPPLLVFGHIHASYGREDIILDSTRRAHDQIAGNRGGWGALCAMCVGVCLARIRRVLFSRDALIDSEKVTTLINASIVRESWNKELNIPFVVEL